MYQTPAEQNILDQMARVAKLAPTAAHYSARDICRETNGADVCDSADACAPCRREAQSRNLKSGERA